MGQSSPSQCCGAIDKYENELDTESAVEYIVTGDAKEMTDDDKNTEQQTAADAQPKEQRQNTSDAEHNSLLKERHKYRLQTSHFQQQLFERDKAFNEYKTTEQEYDEYKQQNVELSEAKTELQNEINRLNEMLSKHKQPPAIDKTETYSEEVTQLKDDIERLQKEKEAIQQNQIEATQRNENNQGVQDLHNKLQQITQQLQAQQTENESLKCQLNQQNVNNIDQKMVMHQHIQITNLPILPDADEIDVLSAHVVSPRDKIQNDRETRVLNTLRSTSSLHKKDIKKIVMKQYRTVRFEDDDSSDFENNEDDNVSSLSSIESDESHEKNQMKKELLALQTQSNTLLLMKTEPIFKGSQQSQSSSSLNMLPKQSNLYRTGSKEWTHKDVVQEKREMQAAMEALLKSHMDSNSNIKDGARYDTV